MWIHINVIHACETDLPEKTNDIDYEYVLFILFMLGQIYVIGSDWRINNNVVLWQSEQNIWFMSAMANL